MLFNTPEEGLTEDEAAERLLKFGKNQLPEKEDNKLVKLALEFVQPMPLMIWAAIFIEARRARARRARCPAAGAAAQRAPGGARACPCSQPYAGAGGHCAAPVR